MADLTMSVAELAGILIGTFAVGLIFGGFVLAEMAWTIREVRNALPGRAHAHESEEAPS